MTKQSRTDIECRSEAIAEQVLRRAQFVASRLTSNRAEAEDIASDLVEDCLKRLKAFNAAAGSLPHFIRMVMQHRLVLLRHRRHRDGLRCGGSIDDTANDQMVSLVARLPEGGGLYGATPDPDAGLLHRDRQRIIEVLRREGTPRQRAIIDLSLSLDSTIQAQKQGLWSKSTFHRELRALAEKARSKGFAFA